MTPPDDLAALARLLRGAPAPEVDWRPAVDLANRALLTPRLSAVVDKLATPLRPPRDVGAFLGDVARRNDERNERLRSQLRDAVGALHRDGIGCTLLKGTAFLAEGEGDGRARMLADLDLLVAPEETDRSVAALGRAGFQVLARYGEGPHAARRHRRSGA